MRKTENVPEWIEERIEEFKDGKFYLQSLLKMILLILDHINNYQSNIESEEGKKKHNVFIF